MFYEVNYYFIKCHTCSLPHIIFNLPLDTYNLQNKNLTLKMKVIPLDGMKAYMELERHLFVSSILDRSGKVYAPVASPPG